MYALSDKDFTYISSLLYSYARINLTEKKRSLIISRLSKRIRILGLDGFPQYIEYLEDDVSGKDEFQNMVNALSTNYSAFFREPYHFDYVANTILPCSADNELHIWSAACSTGQEIYSILITLLEYELRTKNKLKYHLYASDISDDVLRKAAKGEYHAKDVEKMDKNIVYRYFLKGSHAKKDFVKVKNNLIRRVLFFKMNLSDDIYRLPKMDIVFLRNVLIYFDAPTKQELIERMHEHIRPQGYLFLGHSESLINISSDFKLVGQTIYRRKD